MLFKAFQPIGYSVAQSQRLAGVLCIRQPDLEDLIVPIA